MPRRQRGFIINPYVYAVAGGTTYTHRYWRVLISSNNGSGFVSIGEVFFVDGGGVDISTAGKTYAASASLGGAYTAAAAFNGSINGTSYWAANAGGSLPQWLSIDFGSAVTVGRVDIGLSTSASASEAPRNFDIQSSDNNSTWTTRKSVTAQTFTPLGTRFQFAF